MGITRTESIDTLACTSIWKQDSSNHQPNLCSAIGAKCLTKVDELIKYKGYITIEYYYNEKHAKPALVESYGYEEVRRRKKDINNKINHFLGSGSSGVQKVCIKYYLNLRYNDVWK